MGQRASSNTKGPSFSGRAAVIERLRARTGAAGNFSAPCIPALLDHYFDKIVQLFASIDRPLHPGEVDVIRSTLHAKVEEGFAISPYARFVLAYEPSETRPGSVTCSISIVAPTLAQQYDEWLRQTAGEEPFGEHADAKVMHVACALPHANRGPVLDVGAGAGRNSVELAKLGLVVHALEPQAAMARLLREKAAREQLSIEVMEAELLADAAALARDHYSLIVLSEVTPHFSLRDAEVALAKVALALRPGGTLLFNAFVSKPGSEPELVAQQAAQGVWSTFFTSDDLTRIARELSLVQEDDCACIAYEQAHLPSGAWPPTSWYENWANGHNLYSMASEDPPPIELRWLEYRRR